MVLVRDKWIAAWKCWSNPSSSGLWQARTTKKECRYTFSTGSMSHFLIQELGSKYLSVSRCCQSPNPPKLLCRHLAAPARFWSEQNYLDRFCLEIATIFESVALNFLVSVFFSRGCVTGRGGTSSNFSSPSQAQALNVEPEQAQACQNSPWACFKPELFTKKNSTSSLLEN